MAKKKIALVSSLKTKTFKIRFKCFINIIFYSILSLLFLLINNKIKFQKFSKKLSEVLTYKTPKNYGHGAVSGSMIRGLKNLNIPFTINDINKDTEIVILLATTPEELEELSKLKKLGKIKKIVTTPVCSTDSKFVFQLPVHECVDIAFIASDYVKNIYKKELNNPSLDVMNKVVPWPSGVQVEEKIHENKFSKSCICYFKRTPVNEELVKMLESKGIKVHCFEYYKYRFEDYMNILKKVDFVIFNQNYIETQGLAMAEDWAKNRPTFINYDKNEFGGITAPYLTPQTGLFYLDLNGLEKIVDEYIELQQTFLDKYTPQKWTIENMSDKSTVKELLKLLGI